MLNQFENQYVTSCTTSVKEVTENGVIFHETVAFPESGAQIGDTGILKNSLTGEVIKFLDCQKIRGKKSTVPEFSDFFIEAEVVHHVLEKDLKKFKIGESWSIEVDWERRAKISANHTGTHLLFLALNQLRDMDIPNEKVAKITDEYGRIDFTTAEKFNSQEIAAVENLIHEMIDQEFEITADPHPEAKETFYWSCNGKMVPCAGTHIQNTKFLKSVSVETKDIGEGAERVVAVFQHEEELFKRFNRE